MNSLVFLQEEITDLNLENSSGTAKLHATRYEYFKENFSTELGKTFPCAIFNQKRGIAKLTKLDSNHAEFSLEFNLPILPKNPSIAIVAVPRPQTVKKVIHICTTMGISALHFIRSENVEKSYLKSKALEENAIQAEAIKGLEQACDSHAPEIKLHTKFKPFVEDFLPEILKDSNTPKLKLIAHTSIATTDQKLEFSKSNKAIICIGPESGWNDFEVNSFKNLGFQQINLGQRILRVETALCALLGKFCI